MSPGEEVEVTILLPPTSNLFAAGHRIRVDVSSSNFPRLERNPNTGEPIGRHTHMVKADQTVFGGHGRAAGHPVIEWRRRSGRAVPRWGSEPPPRIPPDDDERPRRVVRLDPFRLARTPVTTQSGGSTAEGDDDAPVTYVSFEPRREAFCARGSACGCRPRRSGRRRRAAATTGSGRGATSCPTRSRADFAAGIGEPEPVGSSARPARRRTACSTWPATSWSGRRVLRRERLAFAAARSSTGRTSCAARTAQPMHPGARDHYVGFRVVAASVRAARLRLGRRARRRVAIGRDPVATAARRRRRVRRTSSICRVRALAHAGDERRSTRPFVAEAARGAARLAGAGPRRARRPSGRRSSTGSRRPRSARGPAAACRPRPSGRRRRAAPTARATHGATRPTRAAPRSAPGSKRGDDLAGRRPSGRREPVRSAGHGGQRLGVDVERVPAVPVRADRRSREPVRHAERVLRGGSFVSPGLRFCRCAMRSRSRRRAVRPTSDSASHEEE